MGNKIRIVLGVIIMVLSIVVAAYVGVWCMFIQPILDACRAFDTGTLTGMIIGITVLKCIFSGTVSAIIILIGRVIGSIFITKS